MYERRRITVQGIEVQGDVVSVERFLQVMRAEPPPLATIEYLEWETLPPNGDTSFRIETSRSAAEKQVFISPDVCICADCLRELFDSGDRR